MKGVLEEGDEFSYLPEILQCHIKKSLIVYMQQIQILLVSLESYITLLIAKNNILLPATWCGNMA